MRVACRQGCGVGAGSRRRNVGRSCEAALGRRRRSRGARRAGLITPAGIAAPTPAWVVGARPPPRGQPSRPTSLAADAAGAADNLGVFQNAVACRCAPRSIAAASGAAEAGRWAGPQPQRGPVMRVVCRQGCGVGPDHAAVTWGALHRCVGRAPPCAWGAAGRNSVRLPVSPRPRPHGWWAPAQRPAAQPAAQHRSQRTPLAWP